MRGDFSGILGGAGYSLYLDYIDMICGPRTDCDGLFLEHPETCMCFSYQERILCHSPSNLDSRRAWLTEYDRSGTVIVPGPRLNKLTAFTSYLLGHLLFKPHHRTVRRPTPCCGETQARGPPRALPATRVSHPGGGSPVSQSVMRAAGMRCLYRALTTWRMHQRNRGLL